MSSWGFSALPWCISAVQSGGKLATSYQSAYVIWRRTQTGNPSTNSPLTYQTETPTPPINQHSILHCRRLAFIFESNLRAVPSCGGQASPGDGVFLPGWRGLHRHTVWQHGTAERQEAAQSYTRLLYTLAFSSLPECCGVGREMKRMESKGRNLD